MMMLAVMYGMIPRAKIEKLSKPPPENRLRNPSAPCVLAADLIWSIGQRVDARNPDRHAEPVEHDHHDREQDLVAKIRDLEDVLQVGEHCSGCLCLAAVIGRRAVALTGLTGW